MRTLTALAAALLISCSDSSPSSQGGHTNWLQCEELSDCNHPDAAGCQDGFCVDADGQRLLAPAASAGTGGSAGVSGAAGVSSAASGSGGAPAAGSGTGGSAGAGGAGAGGNSGSGGTGEPAAGSADTSAPQGPACGPNVCQAGFLCCDSCTGSCVSELSGANCPNADACPDAGSGVGAVVAQVALPDCPGTFVRCARTTGGCAGQADCVECPPTQVCLELDLSCGAAGGSTAQCVDDPCADATVDCNCGQPICDALSTEVSTLLSCQALSDPPVLTCAGGGRCAAPDTPIATPDGEVPIADLSVGDQVYSLEADGVVVVPIAVVARTPVAHHRVLRLELDDGSVLEVTGLHPLADGRPLSSLAPGDAVGERVLRAVESVDYTHPFTHDILPASSTGAYLARGVWLGSTLSRAARERAHERDQD